VGNDDVGQMSAWLVFAMLGLYPAQPFSAEYVLGEPMLQADIQLPEGRVLRIRGKGPRAHWNGVAQQTPAMTHQELAEGGTLRFSAVEPQRP
jgi:putative alpha-1,2-mannosidase